MKSLFVRLLISMWGAMALLVGAFVLIQAWALPPEAGEHRQKFSARAAETRGENALLCSRQGLPDCERSLKARDSRDPRLALYTETGLALGEAILGGPELAHAARQSPERSAFRTGEHELTAVVLDRDPRYVAVAEGPVRTHRLFIITPETLPTRLFAIILVTGLVAVLLARYLSRPIARLRWATQQIARGDLSVRVAHELTHADGETRALGRDLDGMAERIQALLDSERRLRRDVSHELRSPLTRLNIAIELIRRRSPPDLAPAFERIERDTARLDAMIGELLTLNRLESEGMERREPVELAALVEQVAFDVALEAEQRGCRVEVEAKGPCNTLGNRELLRRAIENVLRNAVRFTPAGSVVHMDLQCSPSSARLDISDQGAGVPPEALAHLFKPFYRVEGDRARNSGGTGLGLAITEQAVLLHGGKVQAQNREQGQGLVVSIELPVVA